MQAGSDRQAREAVRELLVTLSIEFDRLADENEALVQELDDLRSQPSTAQGPAKGGRLRVAAPQPARPSNHSYTDVRPLEVSSSFLSEPGQQDLASDRASSLIANGGVDDDVGYNSSASRGDDMKGYLEKNLEAEDHYENLYDLTRAFHALCGSGRASIGAYELLEMNCHQQGFERLRDTVVDDSDRFEKAITALNKVLNVMSPESPEMPSKEIHLDTFIAIMQQTEAQDPLTNDPDEDVEEAILVMKDIMVREDALRKVAKATNVEYGEIYQASRRSLVIGRTDRVLKYLDPIIGVVIMLNAIIIGVSTDYARDSDAWMYVEFAFTLIFVMELVIKNVAFGVHGFFCGPDMTWNLFDTCVVIIAVFDLVFTLLGSIVNLRNFTIVRLLRFARLTKLVRVLRLKVFKELALLINGILAGFRTLLWAIVFLGFLQFALGVMLTQTVGHTEVSYWETICDGTEGDVQTQCLASAQHLRSYRKELFGNVHRSMFTVFRCFTDGCGSVDGTPLMPYFYNTHGLVTIIIYMIVALFVLFGLFNLIMAVFVENTIENAKFDDARRREARANEHVRVAKKLQEVIVMFCTGDEGYFSFDHQVKRRTNGGFGLLRNMFSTSSARSSGSVTQDLSSVEEGSEANGRMSNLKLEVTHAAFMKMLQRSEVQEMLDDLDVGVNSRASLFEVLDANCNGTLEVNELVQGLLKLRGSADKGDVIASLLAIRSIQKSIKAMEVLGLHQQDVIENIANGQERVQASLAEMQQSRRSLGFASKVVESLKFREGRAEESPPSQSPPVGSSSRPLTPGLNTMRADAERRRSSFIAQKPKG